jgi:hypothetical protein
MSAWNDRIAKNPPITDNLQALYYYTGGGLIEYVCQSKPKTKMSENKWQIVKFVYNGTKMTQRIFANGNENFVHRADEYSQLEYTIEA